MVGSIVLRSALGVRGQQSSQAAVSDTPSETSAAPISTAPRTPTDMPPNPRRLRAREASSRSQPSPQTDATCLLLGCSVLTPPQISLRQVKLSLRNCDINHQ